MFFCCHFVPIPPLHICIYDTYTFEFMFTEKYGPLEWIVRVLNAEWDSGLWRSSVLCPLRSHCVLQWEEIKAVPLSSEELTMAKTGEMTITPLICSSRSYGSARLTILNYR